MGVASLVLGILAIISCWIPCVGQFAIAPGVLGIVFGAIGISKAKKTNQGKGVSVAGLVLSIISTAVAVIWCLVIGAAAKSTADDINKTTSAISESAEKWTKDLDDANKKLNDGLDNLDKASKALDNLKF